MRTVKKPLQLAAIAYAAESYIVLFACTLAFTGRMGLSSTGLESLTLPSRQDPPDY